MQVGKLYIRTMWILITYDLSLVSVVTLLSHCLNSITRWKEFTLTGASIFLILSLNSDLGWLSYLLTYTFGFGLHDLNQVSSYLHRCSICAGPEFKMSIISMLVVMAYVIHIDKFLLFTASVLIYSNPTLPYPTLKPIIRYPTLNTMLYQNPYHDSLHLPLGISTTHYPVPTTHYPLLLPLSISNCGKLYLLLLTLTRFHYPLCTTLYFYQYPLQQVNPLSSTHNHYHIYSTPINTHDRYHLSITLYSYQYPPPLSPTHYPIFYKYPTAPPLPYNATTSTTLIY